MLLTLLLAYSGLAPALGARVEASQMPALVEELDQVQPPIPPSLGQLEEMQPQLAAVLEHEDQVQPVAVLEQQDQAQPQLASSIEQQDKASLAEAATDGHASDAVKPPEAPLADAATDGHASDPVKPPEASLADAATDGHAPDPVKHPEAPTTEATTEDHTADPMKPLEILAATGLGTWEERMAFLSSMGMAPKAPLSEERLEFLSTAGGAASKTHSEASGDCDVQWEGADEEERALKESCKLALSDMETKMHDQLSHITKKVKLLEEVKRKEDQAQQDVEVKTPPSLLGQEEQEQPGVQPQEDQQEHDQAHHAPALLDVSEWQEAYSSPHRVGSPRPVPKAPPSILAKVNHAGQAPAMSPAWMMTPGRVDPSVSQDVLKLRAALVHLGNCEHFLWTSGCLKANCYGEPPGWYDTERRVAYECCCGRQRWASVANALTTPEDQKETEGCSDNRIDSLHAKKARLQLECPRDDMAKLHSSLEEGFSPESPPSILTTLTRAGEVTIIKGKVSSCWGTDEPRVVTFDQSSHRISQLSSVTYTPSGFFWIVKNNAIWIQARNKRLVPRLWAPKPSLLSTRDLAEQNLSSSEQPKAAAVTVELAVGGPFMLGHVLILKSRSRAYFDGKQVLLKPGSELTVPSVFTGKHRAHDPKEISHGSPRRSFTFNFELGMNLTVIPSRTNVHWIVAMRRPPGRVEGHCGNFDGNPKNDMTAQVRTKFMEVDTRDLLFKEPFSAPDGDRCTPTVREEESKKCRAAVSEYSEHIQQWVDMCVFVSCYPGYMALGKQNPVSALDMTDAEAGDPSTLATDGGGNQSEAKQSIYTDRVKAFLDTRGSSDSQWTSLGESTDCKLDKDDHTPFGRDTVMTFLNVYSQAHCRGLCESVRACRGIEYKSKHGDCEIWTRPIGFVSSVKDSECLSYAGHQKTGLAQVTDLTSIKLQTCCDISTLFGIELGNFGEAPQAQVAWWQSNNCDDAVGGKLRPACLELGHGDTSLASETGSMAVDSGEEWSPIASGVNKACGPSLLDSPELASSELFTETTTLADCQDNCRKWQNECYGINFDPSIQQCVIWRWPLGDSEDSAGSYCLRYRFQK